MSDYKQTRDAAGMVTSRFDKTLRNLTDNMLRNLSDDYEDEIVVVSLMRYYKLCLDNNDDSILGAIERVLEDYMCTADYSDWLLTRKG
jgi:hypothetical protein